MAFVPTDEPVEFRTTDGKFVHVNDAPGPFTITDNVYLCNSQYTTFDDCNSDGLSLKHLVVVPLGGYGATPGKARITVSQGAKNASLDFTVVGEPSGITIDAYRTTIGNGVTDIQNSYGDPLPDGKLTGPDECPLPTTEGAILAALAKTDRTVLIARVTDAQALNVTQAWVQWGGTGQSWGNPPTIGAVGHLSVPITPTYDLGSFGVGAPQLLCGTTGTGIVPVTAQLTKSAMLSGGLVVDPQAGTASTGVDIEVISPALDTDTDGIPDLIDNCRFVSNPTQLNTDAANTAANRPGADALGDACDDSISGDGYTNAQHTALGKDPAVYCTIMRADVDGDGHVSILDLAKAAAYFTQTVPPAPERYKQDADNKISILDLTRMAQVFTQHVNACP